jgi:DNA repair protein RadC
VIRGRAGVKSYVTSLGKEAHEWLLALYVDREMQLLSIDTLARGDIGSCPIPFNRIIARAFEVGASAYILAHNHPSGDARPSNADMRATVRLAKLSADLEIPMLDHLIVAGDEIVSCGYF